ncbi:hypothetical protein C8R47DRAFT_1226470 [Mycena vitilis]|nr:hypothetical protein C8R47DRAFT_1226470 [Mycena vitilis]
MRKDSAWSVWIRNHRRTQRTSTTVAIRDSDIVLPSFSVYAHRVDSPAPHPPSQKPAHAALSAIGFYLDPPPASATCLSAETRTSPAPVHRPPVHARLSRADADPLRCCLPPPAAAAYRLPPLLPVASTHPPTTTHSTVALPDIEGARSSYPLRCTLRHVARKQPHPPHCASRRHRESCARPLPARHSQSRARLATSRTIGPIPPHGAIHRIVHSAPPHHPSTRLRAPSQNASLATPTRERSLPLHWTYARSLSANGEVRDRLQIQQGLCSIPGKSC